PRGSRTCRRAAAPRSSSCPASTSPVSWRWPMPPRTRGGAGEGPRAPSPDRQLEDEPDELGRPGVRALAPAAAAVRPRPGDRPGPPVHRPGCDRAPPQGGPDPPGGAKPLLGGPGPLYRGDLGADAPG